MRASDLWPIFHGKDMFRSTVVGWASFLLRAGANILYVVMLIKVAKLCIPAALVGTLPLMTGTTFRRERSAADDRFVIPSVRQGSYARSLTFLAIREWNKLPSVIKALDRLASFKRRLMAYLIHMND